MPREQFAKLPSTTALKAIMHLVQHNVHKSGIMAKETELNDG